MKRVGAFIGIIGVLGIGFFVIGRSKSAEGPAQGGGVTSASAPAKPGGAPKGPMAIPVTSTEVTTRQMVQNLEVNGTLATDGEVQVAHRLTGKVMGVYVKEGDRVKRGQPIVLVGMRELPGEIARARGIVAAGQAKLALARNQATFKDASSTADHERAESNILVAKARLTQAQTAAELSDVETRLKVQTAQANLQVAKERLTIAKESTRKQDLRQAQLAVEQASAQANQTRVDMDNAKQYWERRAQLYKQDAIAREEVDEAERRYKSAQSLVRVAEAGVNVAQQKLDLAKEGSRPEEVRVAEEQLRAAEQALDQAKSDERKRQVAQDEVSAAKAAVQLAEANERSSRAGLVQSKMSVNEIANAKAELDQAKADLAILMTRKADLVVKAPLDGVVSTRQVNVGEFMTPSSPLMTLIAMDKVYFEAQVPELEVAMLKPGMSAQVTVDAMPGRKFTGAVREIIPVADRASRAFRVRIAVLGAKNQLPANGYARAKVLVGTRPQTLCVSKDALQTEAGDKYVWLIDGAGDQLKAKRQVVKVGLVDDRYAEILGGVKPGQRIIAAGSPAIIENTPITIQK